MAEVSNGKALVGDDHGFFGLPDFGSVTVRRSDGAIMLAWSSDESSTDFRMIRLVRVSDNGVEPRLWRIDKQHDHALEDRCVDRHEREWIFVFLSPNNKIIDHDGTRHSHPGLVRLSDLQEKEHELCAENLAA